MRNIKVFIASSAELDEDKLQMDLYFHRRIRGIGSATSILNNVLGVISPAIFLKSICRVDTMTTFVSATL